MEVKLLIYGTFRRLISCLLHHTSIDTDQYVSLELSRSALDSTNLKFLAGKLEKCKKKHIILSQTIYY